MVGQAFSNARMGRLDVRMGGDAVEWADTDRLRRSGDPKWDPKKLGLSGAISVNERRTHLTGPTERIGRERGPHVSQVETRPSRGVNSIGIKFRGSEPAGPRLQLRSPEQP